MPTAPTGGPFQPVPPVPTTRGPVRQTFVVTAAQPRAQQRITPNKTAPVQATIYGGAAQALNPRVSPSGSYKAPTPGTYTPPGAGAGAGGGWTVPTGGGSAPTPNPALYPGAGDNAVIEEAARRAQQQHQLAPRSLWPWVVGGALALGALVLGAVLWRRSKA